MDQVIAKMDQISIESPLEQPTSPPSSPPPPSPYLPPEILSHIFKTITHDLYEKRHATFAQLCLVNRCFLPIAREFLYSTLNLYLCTNPQIVVSQRPEDADKVENGVRLFRTLVKVKHLALLVQDIYVSFANLPPLSDDSVQIGGLIRELENLKKIWFEDEGEKWWESEENAEMPDDLMYFRVILSRTKHLEVLAIPQIRFRPVETFHLLNSINRLETFKGELHTPSSRARPTLHLVRLHITAHSRRQDLEFFVFPCAKTLVFPCAKTLCYLRLNYNGDKFIPLDEFIHLEQLVVDVNGHELPTITADLLATNFRPFLHSCHNLPNLSSLTLFLDNLNGMASRIFCKGFFAGGLPRNLREFAVGPQPELLLTWRTFLDHVESSCCHLKKLYLTRAKGFESDKSRNEMMFGVEDLRENYGIEVEWMEKEDWKEWLDERFCPRRE